VSICSSALAYPPRLEARVSVAIAAALAKSRPKHAYSLPYLHQTILGWARKPITLWVLNSRAARLSLLWSSGLTSPKGRETLRPRGLGGALRISAEAASSCSIRL